ncbi:MAG TPA: hypothetical protein VFT31_17210 [Kribbella sp.]|nr:hypothetical protein [Kribbella sp.]
METVVAYAFDRPEQADRVTAGIRRVEAYYSELWQDSARREGCDAGAVGVHLWDRKVSDCRWPSWHDAGDLRVATVHAPIGYERVVGDLSPEQAPGPLARALLRSPERVLELAPPFVLTVLDPEAQHLELFTDPIGVGRLFQLRVPDGWVWSNRPVAACLFADVPAAAAARGWLYAAACGWFMDDTTPYDRVLTVPGAMRIVNEGRRGRRRVSRIDAVSVWAGRDSTDPLAGRVEETADALQAVARSVSRLWPGRPTVDLSGGRDSRVVAAAFLSAGVDLRLNSYDAVPGEAGVAEQLVAALPFPVEHVVTGGSRKATGAPPPTPPVVERARLWHRYGEGLRPASYLFHAPPASLAEVSHLAIGGAGGEIAHGHFYPGDVLKLDAIPLEAKVQAFVERLGSRLIPTTGPAPRARDAVAEQLHRVLRDAIRNGLEDATMLDYFYVVERLRRWGTAGERSGVVSPLLVSEFIHGAFALDPPQRLDNALHRALVRQMVPQWDDIPFFKPAPIQAAPTAPAPTPPRLKRLADAPDRDLVEALLAEPGAWAEGFDVEVLNSLWTASAAGESTAAGEVVLRQMLWRAVFDDHVAEVNRHLSPAARPVVAVTPPSATEPLPEPPSAAQPPAAQPPSTGAHSPAAQRPVRPTSAQSPVKAKPVLRRIRRNPAVRKLARTPVWRAFRRTRIGRSWRRPTSKTS